MQFSHLGIKQALGNIRYQSSGIDAGALWPTARLLSSFALYSPATRRGSKRPKIRSFIADSMTMIATEKRSSGTYRDFAGRRWLVSILRVLHLAGMVGVGAGLLGAAPAVGVAAFLTLLVASGMAMIALDFWSNPEYPRQIAGAAMLVKLGLLVFYLFDAGHRIWLFWVILAVSSLAAHAPARLRHRRLIRSDNARL